VDITWVDASDPRPDDVAGAVAVLEAARLVDAPHEQPCTVRAWLATVQHGWDGEPPLPAVARDDTGRVVGVLHLGIPERDNRHAGWVDLVVDPSARRRGVGRALFEFATTRLRELDRTVVIADMFDSPAAEGFAKCLGLDAAGRDVKRRQDVWALDPSRLAAAASDARTGAAAYELVRIPVPAPAELVPAVLRMIEAINDAPTDDLKIEDEQFSAERLADFYTAQQAAGRRIYHLAARHRETGELGGHTVVAVESDLPYLGHQEDTSVLREHRGHRLGLLLKTGMLEWLADSEPQLRSLDTWNAASNSHMIAVNEQLGYEVVATSTSYQQTL
jgi:GNAT superfamily N-acetyltransferase